MKRGLPEKAAFVDTIEQVAGVRVGKIVGVDPGGSVLVDFADNRRPSLPARITTSAKAKMLPNVDVAGREVLLVFENDDPGLPIVIDTLYSLVDEISGPAPSVIEAEKPDEVFVDGERVVFDAKKEIVLRCGEASITLTKAGKVMIKGTYVVSRSSGANKIKGASIALN